MALDLDENGEIREQDPPTDPNYRRTSRKLTPKAKNYIIHAIAEGQTCADISRALNVHQSTVARFADRYDLRRNRVIAAHKIARVLPRAADNVVAAISGEEPKGNVDISVRLLDRAGVLRIGSDEEKRDDTNAAGTVINVAVFESRGAGELLARLTGGGLRPVLDAELHPDSRRAGQAEPVQALPKARVLPSDS